MHATIAANPFSHSMRIECNECWNWQIVPRDGFAGGDVLQAFHIKAVEKSLEQFRESGTYRQTATCPNSVNLNSGKLHESLTFGYYKKFDK